MIRRMEKRFVTNLAATLTHVRLLASVHTLVNGQSRSLDELLTAVGVVADVRADTAVDPLCRMVSAIRNQNMTVDASRLTMTRQIAATSEAFAASRTGESLWGAGV